MAGVPLGRLRSFLAEAQGLVTEVRSLPLDPDTSRRAYPLLFNAAAAVKRYQDAVVTLEESEAREMWEQRGMWLQEEVAALLAERTHSTDQLTYWMNLLLLLFTAAAVVEGVQSEKSVVEERTASLRAHVSNLEAQITGYERALKEARESAAVPAAVAEEVLELRSQLVVAGQRAATAGGEVAALTEQIKAITAERDALHALLQEARAKAAEAEDIGERRLEVIQTMMIRNEESSSQMSKLKTETVALSNHCTTLASNLESHAAVIEKLVALNTELMDTLNSRSAAQERDRTKSSISGEVSSPTNVLSNNGPAPQSALTNSGPPPPSFLTNGGPPLHGSRTSGGPPPSSVFTNGGPPPLGGLANGASMFTNGGPPPFIPSKDPRPTVPSFSQAQEAASASHPSGMNGSSTGNFLTPGSQHNIFTRPPLYPTPHPQPQPSTAHHSPPPTHHPHLKPELQNPHAAQPTIPPTASKEPAATSSFADAFEAFLKEPDPPVRATAASLATPPLLSSSGPNSGGRRQGWASAFGFVGSGSGGRKESNDGKLEVVVGAPSVS